jgi:hypothetical protein
VATTCGDGAGAVRVSGVPSGGVSGAGALVDAAGADDVGSVIDFLSGAASCVCVSLASSSRFGFKEQIYSTLGGPT